MAQIIIIISEETLLYKILNGIPSIFEKIIKNNKSKGNSKPSVFDSRHEISLSFEEYFIRLIELCESECNTIIYAFILIDKICENKKVILSLKNVHKVFFTALFIALKMNEDVIYNEKHFSIASGMSHNEIAILEKEFADKLDYKLNVSNDKLEIYLNALI